MKTNYFSIQRGWETLEVQGPDARDYFQRLSSADFKSLREGQFTPATFLSATGKIQIYFKALCINSERYLFLIPPQSPSTSGAAIEIFERMHFRENFTIEQSAKTLQYLRVIGTDLKPLAAKLPELSKAHEFKKTEYGFVLFENKWNQEAAGSSLAFDLGFLSTASELSALSEMLKQSGFEERQDLEGFRIRASDPAFPNELGPNTIPLEAHLSDAVHENKGCYPGQEVIERIRSMGQIPRTLCLIKGQEGLPEIGHEVRVGDQIAGTLTSVAKDPIEDGWVGLSFIKRVFAKSESSYKVANQDVVVHFMKS